MIRPSADNLASTPGIAAGKREAPSFGVLDLPTDRPRPAVRRLKSSRCPVLLSRHLTHALRELSTREGFTLSQTLLAGFQALLWHYTGGKTVFSSILSVQDLGATKSAIGLFTHAHGVSTDEANLSDESTFLELLRRQRTIQTRTDPNDHVEFQVLFSSTDEVLNHEFDWQMSEPGTNVEISRSDLHLNVHERAESVAGYFAFDTDLFDTSTISRMTEHFRVLLKAAVNNPDQPISRLPLLTSAEQHKLLVQLNETQSDYPRSLAIHQLFEAQAERTPDATAVIFDDGQLTYAELNERANQLAHHLSKLGVGPEALVGIGLERSLEMVVGLLGILKAGGAYVPLDPSYPRERITFMLEDAEVQVLITQSRLVEDLPQTKAKLVLLDAHWPEIRKENRDNPTNRATPENLAYVIYTSGSTGKPKGVQIPHRAVVNFLTSMADEPGLTRNDHVLAVTTLSFDIAGLEIFLPLTVGACVEIVSRHVSSDGNRLLAKLLSSSATAMQATPVTWRILLEAGWRGSPSLKCLCGGEAVSRKLADDLLSRTGSVWNMYGPTETTIWSTTARVEPGEGLLSIGKPIANTQIFILDKLQQPVPIGVPGELYIGGDGLARGYLKRPDLTKEKFVTVAFGDQTQQRLYRTGDLVRYLSNGEIQFLGRIDHQVKIRGFRIELGEIEAALRKHQAVLETVVVADEDPAGGHRLVAYFVPASEPAPASAELRSSLSEKLPEHMIPARFIALKAMPLTPNGKIDRKALPNPALSELDRTREYVEPQDILEAQLVKMWEEILSVRPIGIRHSFFELGGNSLLAVRLMQKVKQQFGRDLQIASLFEAPTPEKLAGILRRKGWSSPWSSLVPIQTGGSQTPFFCVHGAGGTVLRFYDLARYLGVDRAIYGLQARGLHQEDSCDTRIEEMAARYLTEIRETQPTGPYLFGGYSFGGLVAFEMARMVSADHQQATVVLFDTFCPQLTKTSAFASLTLPARALSSASLKYFRTPAARRRAEVSDALKTIRQGIERRLRESRVPATLKKVRKACRQAAANYAPGAFHGPVILFRSQKTPLLQFDDSQTVWSEYALGELEVHEIQGNHDDVLREPQVRMIAERLRACLERHEAQVPFNSLQPSDVQLFSPVGAAK